MATIPHRHSEAYTQIDITKTLNPTKAFYINEKHSSLIRVVDVTKTVITDTLDLEDADLLSRVETVATNGPVSLEIMRRAAFSSRRDVIDRGTHEIVRELKGSVLSFGHWTLTFPANNTHPGQPITIQPIRLFTPIDGFLLNGLPYFWSTDHGGGLLKLYKMVDDSRVEIGRFIGHSPKGRKGLLAVDDTEINDLVALITCISELDMSESFGISFR
ncbi:hypothetical protein BX600DRAFT_444076 [Xylariales sp. PMI_506]|nr:hypothetical protein BX600DRAFT_444076 [Xylariales sp. PMI_506]